MADNHTIDCMLCDFYNQQEAHQHFNLNFYTVDRFTMTSRVRAEQTPVQVRVPIIVNLNH